MPEARSADEHPRQSRPPQLRGADVDVRDQLHLLCAACPLPASDLRYRELLDDATDIVYVHDLQGNFTYVNAAGVRVYGYPMDEILGHNIATIIDPEYLGRARDSIVAKIQHGGSTPPYELLTRTKTGAPVWVEVSTRIVRDETGAPAAIHGIARDVSARKQAEEALARARDFHDRVMESTTNAITAADLRGRLTLVNSRMCEMTGYGMDELLGEPYRKLFVEASFELAQGPFAAAASGGAVDDLELELVRKDGVVVIIRLSVRPLMEDGVVVGVVALAEDITERKRSEEALREGEERYRQMFESTSAVRLLIDPETRCVMEPNEAACAYYGYTREDLTGMDMARINTRPPKEISQLMAEAAGAGRGFFQFQHRLASGAVRDVEVYTGPVVVRGKRYLMTSVFDITERKRAEALIAAQRQLLEIVAVGAPLSEVLDSVASTVESLLPGALCSILLVDQEGQTLRTGAAPSLPASYTQAIDGVAIGPDVGSCGTAVHRRASVIVRDIAEDPLWVDFKDLALAHSLRSCWSSPIVGDSGSVLGAFAIYRRAPHEPGEFERELVGIVTHIAGIAIERQRSEDAIRARAAELERISAQLMLANDDLAGQRGLLEEQSALLEAALASERERSCRDALTGTLNHAAIADEARSLIERSDAGPLALAMVDVDGLKAVNDIYGHQMGDAVLLAVARALQRDGAIVGRYGGDEFIAILPDADRAAAAAYQRHVTDALAAVDLRDGDTRSRIQIVASIGLAIYPEEADAVEGLIKLSDSAMYASRRQRAETTASTAFARVQGGDLAAAIVGEIVPFLTSPGDLNEKLSLVAARLSSGAGYDAVNFSLYGAKVGVPSRSASFAGESRAAAEQYDVESLPPDEPGPMRMVLESTRRPVVIDDLQGTEFATPAQKDLFRTVGLLSALVAPMIWRGEVIGMVSVASKQPAAFGPRDAQFLSAIATQVTAIVRTAALVDDLQSASDRLLQAHTETVVMLAAAAEAHDDTTGRHLQRVREIAQALAAELGHDEKAAKEIGLAAVLHDIGKIRVPDYVLVSSASLSDNEWTLMKEHTVWGSEFLGSRGGFELAMHVARSHHERWDGSGYPDGLLGDLIPEAAAITSVADSLDAMINNRPYRAGRPLADAVLEIQAWSGRQFSPRIVDALVALHERGELAHLVAGDEHDQLAA
jgi:diguanylate cyclase (GGDEF)-like protein/PAS domain S-box-containing protein